MSCDLFIERKFDYVWKTSGEKQKQQFHKLNLKELGTFTTVCCKETLLNGGVFVKLMVQWRFKNCWLSCYLGNQQ